LSLVSRFISELPEDVLERIEKYIPHRPSTAHLSSGIESDASFDINDEYSDLQVGRWVMHPTWGEGRIIARHGMSEATELDVLFRLGGRKKLLAKYANLRVKG
jgi:hypothetical protein